jgi:hypothetical protein
VHGAHWQGADLIGSLLWTGWGLAEERHPAQWNGPLGKGAGPARNAKMVRLGAVVCLAFILDDSPGASGCAKLAQAAGIRTIIDTRHFTGTPPPSEQDTLF